MDYLILHRLSKIQELGLYDEVVPYLDFTLSSESDGKKTIVYFFVLRCNAVVLSI